MESVRELRLDLRKLLSMLAHAIDLVGVDDHLHGRRVGMLAVRLARRLGLDAARQERLYDASLVHDCGVSSTREHRSLVVELEWAEAQRHCDLGHDRLASFAPLAHLAPIVLRHHTRWSDLVAGGVDPGVALDANLVFLVDRVDVLSAPSYADLTLLGRTDAIRAVVEQHRGDVFSPALVDAFLAESTSGAFWMPLLSPEDVQTFQASMSTGRAEVPLDGPTLRQAARLFAEIVDAKSPYTRAHSSGVARLARLLAGLHGFEGWHGDLVEVAGLMHDLGKLQIPDEVLEAPRRLTGSEADRMKTHPWVTFRILTGAGMDERVAGWAAHHHERLDGSGYPFRLADGQIAIESRLIGVADVFQALAQDRPYRPAMPPQDILEVLRGHARRGELDGGVVTCVADHLAACHRAALGQD